MRGEDAALDVMDGVGKVLRIVRMPRLIALEGFSMRVVT